MITLIKKMWKIIRWILAIFLILFMFISSGIPSVLFALAALLVIPIEKLTDLKRKMKISPKLTVFLTMIFFFVGCLTIPSNEAEPAEENVTKEASIEESEDKVEEETEKIVELEIQEEKADVEIVVEESTGTIPEDSTFTIRFLDMGQADATLVECDGHYMLIDGGNKDDSSKMYTILEDSKIDHLDIVVGTHADEDHIGGLAGALNYAAADVILCPTLTHDTEAFKDFVKYADQNGGGILVPEVGDEYALGSSLVSILGVNGGSALNDTSIILKVTYGDTSFLFTGDAEGEAEQAVIDSGADLSATVLKVGHHGSSDSTADAFLQKVMPAYAIISVGAENTYLHPTDITLDKLENINAEVFRTDLQGEIMLTSDGETVNITTEKTASKEEIMTSGEEAAAIEKAQLETEEKAKAEAQAEAMAKAEEESKKQNSYTYSTLNSKMYASQAVNVRSLPNTDGEKLGGLSYSQEVEVTGQCTENGWYRIVYQGKEAYVSDKYLVSEKPVQSQSSQQNSASSRDNSSAGVTAPSGTDYVLNTNTGKFHYPSCRSVKQMKAKNAAYYNGTRDEVIAMGYDPCGNCHP